MLKLFQVFGKKTTPAEGSTGEVPSFVSDMKCNILNSTDEMIQFELIGIDSAIANAFRRILLAEVCVMVGACSGRIARELVLLLIFFYRSPRLLSKMYTSCRTHLFFKTKFCHIAWD